MGEELRLFCDFLEDSLHLGQIHQTGEFIYIYGLSSKFRINLTDKKRFGRYTVYHMNYAPSRIDEGTWHVQQYCNSIYYALFINYTHDWREKKKTHFTSNTYRDFMRLFHRYQALLYMQDIFARQDKAAALKN